MKNTVGEDLCRLEKLLEALVDRHELQKGEILSLIATWIDVHRPGAVEEYEDGSSPVYFYGAEELRRKL